MTEYGDFIRHIKTRFMKEFHIFYVEVVRILIYCTEVWAGSFSQNSEIMPVLVMLKYFIFLYSDSS